MCSSWCLLDWILSYLMDSQWSYCCQYWKIEGRRFRWPLWEEVSRWYRCLWHRYSVFHWFCMYICIWSFDSVLSLSGLLIRVFHLGRCNFVELLSGYNRYTLSIMYFGFTWHRVAWQHYYFLFLCYFKWHEWTPFISLLKMKV